MIIDKNRIKIAENIHINTIVDDKFVTNSIVIRFMTKHSEGSAAAKALCSSLLSIANKNYPTITAMSQRCSELYGSSIWSRCYKMADTHVMMLGSSFILDKLALEGEELSVLIAQMMTDCIFNPIFSETECDISLFESLKKDLVDSIEAEINEKRGYAIRRAYESAYCNEPLSIPTYGTLDEAKKLTLKDIYDAYRNAIDNSTIEVTVAGGGGFEKSVDIIKNSLSALARENCDKKEFVYKSKLKENTKYVNEKMNVNQCKLVMVFKSEYSNLLANKLMASILGGTAFSKLFMNVREKQSLCYYCAARYVEDRCSLVIDSGVEKTNVQKAIDEINRQLDLIRNGEISEDEINNTKLYIKGSTKGSYDYLSDLISWNFTQSVVVGTNYSPEEYVEKLYEVTKDEIIEAAMAVKLDTVYLMESEEVSENE